VVIAIVGLLSTIVLVSTSGLREQAEIAKTLTWAKSVDSLLGANAVGIWSLDENPALHGATIFDLSGWGNNGTLNTGSDGLDKSAEGVVNGAISFDGVDDYIDIPDNNVFDLGPYQDKFYSAWFKADIIESNTRSIYDHRSNDGGNVKDLLIGVLKIDNEKRVYSAFYYGSGVSSYRLYSDIGIITEGVWYHVALVVDRSNLMSLYLNGDLVDSANISAYEATDLSSDSNVKIGKKAYEASGVLNFDGLIDEVRIYNTALAASQIKSQYYAGLDKLLARGLMGQQEYQKRLTLNQ
jgi:hypothetical protein